MVGKANKSPKKRGEKVQDGRTQVQTKRRNHQQGQTSKGTHKQIKHSNINK